MIPIPPAAQTKYIFDSRISIAPSINSKTKSNGFPYTFPEKWICFVLLKQALKIIAFSTLPFNPNDANLRFVLLKLRCAVLEKSWNSVRLTHGALFFMKKNINRQSAQEGRAGSPATVLVQKIVQKG